MADTRDSFGPGKLVSHLVEENGYDCRELQLLHVGCPQQDQDQQRRRLCHHRCCQGQHGIDHHHADQCNQKEICPPREPVHEGSQAIDLLSDLHLRFLLSHNFHNGALQSAHDCQHQVERDDERQEQGAYDAHIQGIEDVVQNNADHAVQGGWPHTCEKTSPPGFRYCFTEPLFLNQTSSKSHVCQVPGDK